jgi:ribosomal protein S27E
LSGKGFTITCNGCGNKLTVNKAKILQIEYQKRFKIYPWHEERVTIECKNCENETHFDEFEE